MPLFSFCLLDRINSFHIYKITIYIKITITEKNDNCQIEISNERTRPYSCYTNTAAHGKEVISPQCIVNKFSSHFMDSTLNEVQTNELEFDNFWLLLKHTFIPQKYWKPLSN